MTAPDGSSGPDFAAIRGAIANLFQANLSELRDVELYEQVQWKGGLPGMSIWMGDDVPDETYEIGHVLHTTQWIVRVYQSTASATGEVDAQKVHELIAAAAPYWLLRDPRIDPNGPGVVDKSRIVKTSPMVPLDTQVPQFITEITLETTVAVAQF